MLPAANNCANFNALTVKIGYAIDINLKQEEKKNKPRHIFKNPRMILMYPKNQSAEIAVKNTYKRNNVGNFLYGVGVAVV